MLALKVHLLNQFKCIAQTVIIFLGRGLLLVTIKGIMKPFSHGILPVSKLMVVIWRKKQV